MENENEKENIISKIHRNFLCVKTDLVGIQVVRRTIADKLIELKTLHSNMVRENQKEIFVFCLDSFYFQYKLFAMELDAINRNFLMINNRMYCNYYKLGVIVGKYIDETKLSFNTGDVNLHKVVNYSDLEPMKEYKLENICEVHENLVLLIENIYEEISRNQAKYETHKKTQKGGFSISNYTTTLKFETALMGEQAELYVNFMSFYYNSARKHLKRLRCKMDEFFNEIETNISEQHVATVDDLSTMSNMNNDDDDNNPNAKTSDANTNMATRDISKSFDTNKSTGTLTTHSTITMDTIIHTPRSVNDISGITFDENVIETIAEHEIGEQDVSGQDVSGQDVSGQDVSGQDVSGIDVSGIDVSCIDVSGIDVSGQDVSCIDVSGQDVSCIDVSGQDVSGLDVSGLDVSGLDVSGIEQVIA